MVQIKFQKQQTDPITFEVITSIELNGISEDDIRVKWAILAMRYAKQIGESVLIDSLNHIEDTGAIISFTQGGTFGDIDEWELDDWDEDDIENFKDDGGFDINQTLTDEESQMSIGFSLETHSAYSVIGGLATPSVVLAQMVYQALLRKRSLVQLN